MLPKTVENDGGLLVRVYTSGYHKIHDLFTGWEFQFIREKAQYDTVTTIQESSHTMLTPTAGRRV